MNSLDTKNCINHPSLPGIAYCKICNGYICTKCITVIENKKYCTNCYKKYLNSKSKNLFEKGDTHDQIKSNSHQKHDREQAQNIVLVENRSNINGGTSKSSRKILLLGLAAILLLSNSIWIFKYDQVNKNNIKIQSKIDILAGQYDKCQIEIFSLKKDLYKYQKAEEEIQNKIRSDMAFRILSDNEYERLKYALKNAQGTFQIMIVRTFKTKINNYGPI